MSAQARIGIDPLAVNFALAARANFPTAPVAGGNSGGDDVDRSAARAPLLDGEPAAMEGGTEPSRPVALAPIPDPDLITALRAVEAAQRDMDKAACICSPADLETLRLGKLELLVTLYRVAGEAGVDFALIRKVLCHG